MIKLIIKLFGDFMLRNFRKVFQGGRLPMVLLMAMILLGLLAYLSPNMSGSGSQNDSDSVIARVYGRDILKRDLDLIVSGALRNVGKGANREEMIPLLINRTMPQLVRAKLMDELAERHDVVVTDYEIKHTLKSQLKDYGFVGRNGRLLPSSEINNILLNTNGISLKWLENNTASDIARQKLLQQVAIQVPVDNLWLDSEIRVRNEKIGFEYVTIAPDIIHIADPEVSKLEAFYKESGARFQVGPRRVIDYVLLTPTIMQLSTIDDNAAKVTYDSNKDRFTELRASHILFEAASSDELREATKKAKELRIKLMSGYSFSKAAETLSQDPSAKKNKGDLGWFQLGRMHESFEQAAMALNIGEISDPVQTSFGVHLVRLEGRREKGFEQVKEEIKSKLAWEHFTMKAKDQLEQLRKRAGERGNLANAAKKIGLIVQTSQPFLKDSASGVVNLPGSQELIREAFTFKVGDVSRVKQFQDGFIVFRVSKEYPSAILPFSEAKEEALSAWRLEEARKLVMNDARHFLKSGNLKTFGVPVMRNVSTIASLPGDLGKCPAVRKALLETPIGKFTPALYTPDGKLLVAFINSRIPFKPLSFADRRAILEQLQIRLASKMLNDELENMEKIGNNRSGLSSLYGRLSGIWYNKKVLSGMSSDGVTVSNI